MIIDVRRTASLFHGPNCKSTADFRLTRRNRIFAPNFFKIYNTPSLTRLRIWYRAVHLLLAFPDFHQPLVYMTTLVLDLQLLEKESRVSLLGEFLRQIPNVEILSLSGTAVPLDALAMLCVDEAGGKETLLPRFKAFNTNTVVFRTRGRLFEMVISRCGVENRSWRELISCAMLEKLVVHFRVKSEEELWTDRRIGAY